MHYTAAGSVVGQELDGCKNPYGQVRDNKFNIVFFIHDQPQCSKIFRGEEYNNEKSYFKLFQVHMLHSLIIRVQRCTSESLLEQLDKQNSQHQYSFSARKVY